MSAPKLTAAQRLLVLRAAERGELSILNWDVATIREVRDAGLVRRNGPTLSPYVLTDAGRAALKDGAS